ncbi:2TM domain-containing protein [Aquimarina spongiae]|uniref:2TM domain-containing protein n=1 Tax=Aquimarina spongiae TaxID=570521 RepID=A0A1M6CQ99_9FLAO|nr:2TM domain-containing protein [Aquimarina spongiae]SHI63140.1 2TM domain-containing protein [Aquimarina spongiae]
MNDLKDSEAYERAKKKVDAEKGFYSHLTAYVIINIALLLMSIDLDFIFLSWASWKFSLTTPVLWGIGLLIHGICVFGPSMRIFKRWEEDKIKKLMDKDDF